MVFGIRNSNTPRGDAYWSAQDSNLESPALEADALSIGPTDHLSPLPLRNEIHQRVNPKILSGNTSTPSIIIMRSIFIPISSKRKTKALLIVSFTLVKTFSIEAYLSTVLTLDDNQFIHDEESVWHDFCEIASRRCRPMTLKPCLFEWYEKMITKSTKIKWS